MNEGILIMTEEIPFTERDAKRLREALEDDEWFPPQSGELEE